MSTELLRITVRAPSDVFVARQRGREVAVALGMDRQDQVRVATALSEVGRQLLGPDGATVTFQVRAGPVPALVIAITTDHGGPVAGDEGVTAAARLLHSVETAGSMLIMTHRLPATSRPGEAEIRRLRVRLAESRPTSPLDELSVQNQQLMVALEEVQRSRDDLLRVNAELEETNRGVLALYGQLSEEMEQTNQGVVALYAELDERSAMLREATEAKSRFLANASHELRAPVTAIIGLVRLLLDADSDPLTADQVDQLSLVQASADDLLLLVNDLLDLVRAESDRIEPVWATVDLPVLFGQLRGTLLPLARPDVELIIEEPGVPAMVTDQTLLGRILRNLLTNALKFTEHGEVRLTAAATAAGEIVFRVADTGIGIAEADQSRVFEEFYQVPTGLSARVPGTGLGLPFARRLAGLLGGSLDLRSEPGRGSVFSTTLPITPPARTGPAAGGQTGRVLVVAADPGARAALRAALVPSVSIVDEAAGAGPALAALAERPVPEAVFLDPCLTGTDRPALVGDLVGEFADRLLADERLRRVPLMLVVADGADPVPVAVARHATVVMNRTEVEPGTIAMVLDTLRASAPTSGAASSGAASSGAASSEAEALGEPERRRGDAG